MIFLSLIPPNLIWRHKVIFNWRKFWIWRIFEIFWNSSLHFKLGWKRKGNVRNIIYLQQFYCPIYIVFELYAPINKSEGFNLRVSLYQSLNNLPLFILLHAIKALICRICIHLWYDLANRLWQIQKIPSHKIRARIIINPIIYSLRNPPWPKTTDLPWCRSVQYNSIFKLWWHYFIQVFDCTFGIGI